MHRMNGGDPTWLKVLLGLIPVVTALLGGGFAAMNTLSRRVDRFKSLDEVRKTYPVTLNPDKTLEAVIIRELYVIDRITQPDNRKSRRIIYVGFLAMVAISTGIFLLASVEHVSFYQSFKKTNDLAVLSAIVAFGAATLIVVLGFVQWSRQRNSADKAAKAAIKSLRTT